MNFSDLIAAREFERMLCPVEVPGTGESMRVVFRSLSPNDMLRLGERLRDKSLTVYDHAAALVTALPDLTDEGQSVKLTRDMLNRFDARLVRAMVETAIALHTNGPPRPGSVHPFEPLIKGEPCGLVEEWR